MSWSDRDIRRDDWRDPFEQEEAEKTLSGWVVLPLCALLSSPIILSGLWLHEKIGFDGSRLAGFVGFVSFLLWGVATLAAHWWFMQMRRREIFAPVQGPRAASASKLLATLRSGGKRLAFLSIINRSK
jgi:hypothetical protein